MSEGAGFGRLQKHILLGAVFSGIASSIPLLNCLNCLFCILNMGGVALALSMHLKANPEDMLTSGEGALFGLAAGAGAGLIAGLLGLAVNMVMGSALASVLENLPEASRQAFAQGTALGVITIPINVVLFAGFGALAGFLGLQLFFKSRIRKA